MIIRPIKFICTFLFFILVFVYLCGMNDVQLLKNLLVKRRIPQKLLSQKSGVSMAYISRIMHGHVKLTNKMLNRLVGAISQIE